MKKYICVFLTINIFSLVLFGQEKSNCTEFQKSIDETYNFKPSKLSPAERTAKAALMDQVWNRVKAEREVLLPCLREEIRTRNKDSFFRFDASNLLIQIDQSAESKKILIDTYAKVDLDDIDLRYWMPYIAILGFEGFDTSAAGDNWLKHPNPEYYLPQHGTLKVDQENGAMIIYGSMDEKIATPALAKIALQETHPARELAAALLMHQATPESIEALKKIKQSNLSAATKQKINDFLTKPNLLIVREGEPKTSRRQFLDAFQQLVDGKPEAFLKLTIEVPDGEKDVVAVMKEEDIPLIRRARRVLAASANPHSAEWYKSFTSILLTMVWKPESKVAEK